MIQLRKLKILIADDHQVTREGIKTVLMHLPETRDAQVEEIVDGRLLLNGLKKCRFDLLIMDIFLEGIDGLKVLDFIQNERLNIPAIVYSRFDNQRMRKAVMIRGASGFLYKSQPVSDLEKAIRTVLKGQKFSLPGKRKEDPEASRQVSQESFSIPMQERCSLTRREIQVLRLIAEARNNKEIASQLFISEQTVGVHRKNLMRKLGARNKASLVRAAFEFQLIE
jgi:DNA-binding NarL/FixJ family response regulator